MVWSRAAELSSVFRASRRLRGGSPSLAHGRCGSRSSPRQLTPLVASCGVLWRYERWPSVPCSACFGARARVADLTTRSRHAPCRAACKHVPVAPVLIIHSLPSRRRVVASDPSRRLGPPFFHCGGDQETVAASAGV